MIDLERAIDRLDADRSVGNRRLERQEDVTVPPTDASTRSATPSTASSTDTAPPKSESLDVEPAIVDGTDGGGVLL